MKSIVIYDNEGYIISATYGDPSPRKPVGIPYLEVDVPEGKQIKIGEDGIGVDVSKKPHSVEFEDLPPTEVGKLRSDLEEAILELTMMIAMGGM